jgi:MFS family permease
MLLEFRSSHAVLSSVFSTATTVSFFLSPFTGNLADRNGPRPVIATGAVLMCLGLVMTAHVHYLPLLYLTYGVGSGSAIACTYVPSIVAVGEWFKVRRVVALGTAVSGIGCGTLVTAPLPAMLIERFGWRFSFEIFGWAGGALLLLSAALFDRPPIIGAKAKISILPKLRTRAFALL